MKKLLIILLLIVGCLFAIGERDKATSYTISKIKPFSKITGYTKLNNGKWKSAKKRIPNYYENIDKEMSWRSFGFGHYNIKNISLYEIKEQPEKLILLFKTKKGKYRNRYLQQDWYWYEIINVFLINKSDLIEHFRYQKNKLTIISIPAQYGIMYVSPYNLLYIHNIKQRLQNMLIANKIDLNLELHYYYYSEKNKIQYFLPNPLMMVVEVTLLI